MEAKRLEGNSKMNKKWVRNLSDSTGLSGVKGRDVVIQKRAIALVVRAL